MAAPAPEAVPHGPELEARLAAFLAARFPAWAPVAVSGLTRFHGGASRETFRITVHGASGPGADPQGRTLIVRRDPSGSLIDTDRALEYAAYQSFWNTPVPVPEPIALETGATWLGRPFFIMSEIEDAQAASPFAPDIYGPLKERLGIQFWSILGHIHGTPAHSLPLAEVVDRPEPEACWRRELDHWERVLDEDELEPQPIARAAIRHLRRNPPPPPDVVTVVHGDYRSGNFLYTDDGRIKGVLDWEMAHLGDPHEDLAWALDPLWTHGVPGRPAGLVPMKQGLILWEEASGLAVNREALAWWRIFAAVKGIGIWVSSAREYTHGTNQDPVLAFSSAYCTSRHNLILLEALGYGDLADQEWR